MLPASSHKKLQVHHLAGRKKKPADRKHPAGSKAPVLTKIVPINPFARWIMPPREAPYLKPKERPDCF